MQNKKMNINFCPRCVKVLAFFDTLQAVDIQWTLDRIMTEPNPEEVIWILSSLVGNSIESAFKMAPLKTDGHNHIIGKTGKRLCQVKGAYVEALKYFAMADASRFKGLSPTALKKAFRRISFPRMYPVSDSEIHHAWRAVIDTKDPKLKGEVLEKLCFLLFASVKGFIVSNSMRTGTEEIDIAIRNESKDPFWEKVGSFILVECKNWSSRCGKNEIVLFKNKIENRFGFCKVGFLVSLNGFATTVNKEMLRSSKSELAIGLLKRADLEELIVSKRRGNLLKEKLEAAVFT